MKEIYEFEGHFDIESLFATMQTKEYRVSRQATLYNTVELLIDCTIFPENESSLVKKSPTFYESATASMVHRFNHPLPINESSNL